MSGTGRMPRPLSCPFLPVLGRRSLVWAVPLVTAGVKEIEHIWVIPLLKKHLLPPSPGSAGPASRVNSSASSLPCNLSSLILFSLPHSSQAVITLLTAGQANVMSQAWYKHWPNSPLAKPVGSEFWPQPHEQAHSCLIAALSGGVTCPVPMWEGKHVSHTPKRPFPAVPHPTDRKNSKVHKVLWPQTLGRLREPQNEKETESRDIK